MNSAADADGLVAGTGVQAMCENRIDEVGNGPVAGFTRGSGSEYARQARHRGFAFETGDDPNRVQSTANASSFFQARFDQCQSIFTLSFKPSCARNVQDSSRIQPSRISCLFTRG